MCVVYHFTAKWVPKQFPPKIFPGTFTKDLFTKRDERTVRDFPKMPHRTFRRIPVSSPHLMQPTRKTGTKKQPLLSFRHVKNNTTKKPELCVVVCSRVFCRNSCRNLGVLLHQPARYPVGENTIEDPKDKEQPSTIVIVGRQGDNTEHEAENSPKHGASYCRVKGDSVGKPDHKPLDCPAVEDHRHEPKFRCYSRGGEKE